MAAPFFSPTPFPSTLSRSKPSKPLNPPPSILPLSSNLVRTSSHPARISKPHPHSGLRIAYQTSLVPQCTLHPLVAARLGDENSEESELPSASESASSSSSETTFDMKLPRRSLLVQFTCNSCGERTERNINRVAYERGTVFVQCAGCLQHHKLVDNLGLVVEYDLREEMDSHTDQV